MPGTVAKLPRTTRSGWVLPSSSSRYVATRSAASGSILPATKRMTSSVASSAQWTSSSTTIVGDVRSSSATSDSARLYGFGPLRTRSSRVPPIVRATSTNGPSGRGMKSGSHAPVTTRVLSATPAQKLLTRALLPTPASPATSTRRPDPAHTSERNRSSAVSSTSRSSRSDLAATAIPGSWSFAVLGARASASCLFGDPQVAAVWRSSTAGRATTETAQTLMELGGLEPPTSWVRSRRSPN